MLRDLPYAAENAKPRGDLTARIRCYISPSGASGEGCCLQDSLCCMDLIVSYDCRDSSSMAHYTHKQGQYLAFIYYYTKIHGRPPAEADIQRYFKVTPPTVHQMVLKLHQLALIERTPGQARSVRVLLPRQELPDLE